MTQSSIRLLSLAVVSFVGASSSHHPAYAQGSVDEARLAFAQGEAAFDAGDAEGALGHFRRAFAASPRAAIRFNVAVCLERLGRYREAVDEYRQAARSDQLDAANVQRATELAELARQHLGVLEATGDPVGAALLVDGERLCALPCRLELDPGEHELVALAEDGRRSEPSTVGIATGAVASAELVATLPPDDSGAGDTVLYTPEPDAVLVRRGPTALTWIGTALAAVGGGLAIGFGIHTLSLEDQYEAMPTRELRDQGITSQIVTNVALGVAILGAVLVVVDVIFFARKLVPDGHARSPSARIAF